MTRGHGCSPTVPSPGIPGIPLGPARVAQKGTPGCVTRRSHPELRHSARWQGNTRNIWMNCHGAPCSCHSSREGKVGPDPSQECPQAQGCTEGSRKAKPHYSIQGKKNPTSENGKWEGRQSPSSEQLSHLPLPSCWCQAQPGQNLEPGKDSAQGRNSNQISIPAQPQCHSSDTSSPLGTPPSLSHPPLLLPAPSTFLKPFPGM